MKKYMPIILTSILLLGGCNAGPKPEDKTVDRIVNRNIYSYDMEEDKITSDKMEVFFKANSEIPYINIKYGFKIFEVIRKTKKSKTSTVDVVLNGKKATVTNDAGATCVLDAEKQTIYFPDFDAFFHNDKAPNPLSLFDTSYLKSIAYSTDHPSEYKKGQAVTVDLTQYSLIDIYQSGGELYMPTQAFSSLFLSSVDHLDIAYNMKDFFLVTVSSPFESELAGFKSLNDYGEKFYSGPKANTISETYVEFNYQTILFNLDYTYGMKKAKNITSFDQYFETKGYKKDMKSTDVHTLDNSFAYALSSLVDFHTVKAGTTPLYGYEDDNADRTKFDKDWLAFNKGSEDLQNAKKALVEKGDIKDGLDLELISGTAFISFNEFTDLNETILYMDEAIKPKDQSVINANTQLLFNDAYKKITSKENEGKIKYVVVDLSTNDGGSISSVVYALCTLLGEIHLSQTNPLTGAASTVYFKADINADGKIDADDKSLYDLGYKIVFLDSKYSFSSANAMPVFAKDNNAKVTILGEKTAGGPCAIRETYNAVGAKYTQSSLLTLSKKQQDGNYIHIDGGVTPDVAVAEENMFNRQFLGSQMETWTDR